MRHRFRPLAMVLCILAMLAAPMTAYASDVPAGPTYDVYQIFTGELAVSEETGETVMTGVRWGRNGTGTVGESVDDSVLNELQAVSGTIELAITHDDRDRLDVILKYVNLDSAAFLSGLSLAELASATAPVGYYYICNTPGSVGSNDGYTGGITVVSSETGAFDVVPKAGSVQVGKFVANLTARQQNRLEHTVSLALDTNMSSGLVGRHSTVAEQGDEIEFTIKILYPENINLYRNFYAELTDAIPDGLVLQEDSVTVEWTFLRHVQFSMVPNYVAYPAVLNGTSENGLASYTKSSSGNVLKIATRSHLFDPVGADEFYGFYTGGFRNGVTGIVISYICKVTDAMAVSRAVTNSAQVKWSNDPADLPYDNDGPAPEHLADSVVTDDSQASVWTPGLIMRLENKSGYPIRNARFTLERTDSYMDINGDEVVCSITECAIRTPVFAEYDAGQYALSDDRYMWIYHLISPPGGLAPDTVRYDPRDNSPVASIGKGVLSLSTDDDGMMVVTGLPCGSYKLHLVEDVKGYNHLDDIEFNIEALMSDGSMLGSESDGVVAGEYPEVYGFQVTLPGSILPTGLSPNEPYRGDNWIYLNMQLTSGIVLPTTGGPGIGLYLISGAVLVLAAGYAIRRKARI